MLILLCNVGSTSLKFKLYQMPQEQLLVEGKIERVGDAKGSIYEYKNDSRDVCVREEKVSIPGYEAGINLFIQDLTHPQRGMIDSVKELSAVGFKTVHAGNISGTQLLTDEVITAMEDYIPVAPLHNHFYVETIRFFKVLLPDTPLIGVFETGFHQTIPLKARIYGTPYYWYQQYGIQKYGFHGSSHQYVASRIKSLKGDSFKLITCHLGGSSSITAIMDGVSVDNSFGFSPQSGLNHSTRVGDLDVFIPLYLISEHGFTAEQVIRELTYESGLYGISGVSSDLRDITARAREGHERSQLAIDSFCYQAKKYIGSYFAILGGLDYLVFSGGIGENSELIRSKICEGLQHLGIILDPEKNINGVGERVISSDDSPVEILVIPTNEEIGIAREICDMLSK